jgi:hypothetical protein
MRNTGETSMSNITAYQKVTIYQFEIYDAQNDEMKKSSRWGTREGIEKTAHGKVLEDSAIEVDKFEVASDIPGLTEKNFIPHHHYGFQTVVSHA